MDKHTQITLAIVFMCLNSLILGAAPKQDQTVPAQRSAKYTSRSAEAATTWQKDVRAKLFELLNMNDLVRKRSSIPLNTKELSSTDRQTYHVREMEINSTSSRRIKIVVTVPASKSKSVPAVVCVGGHGSNLYSPYDTRTIAGDGQRAKADSIYKGFGTVLATMEYVTISTTVSQHKVYEEGRLLMGERLWDLMRCVDYLQSMPEVDGRRIGCAGLSLGACPSNAPSNS